MAPDPLVQRQSLGREVQALCDYLADSSVRLVSVVGRGGIGKTALVSRVLGDLECDPETFEVSETSKVLQVDGILYLSARSTGLGLERIYADAGRMLGEPIAGMLSARWADGDMPLAAKIEYLLEAMQDGLYLILLDNLESAMAEDGTIEEGLRLFIERCLTQPSGVRLIVTSREQVRITAGALHNTRSISLREGLPEDEAAALLRDLDPQGTLGLRDAPEEDLRHAAQLTQSIPRALEILAGILHEDPTASLPRLLADEKLFGEQVVEQLVAAGYRRLGEAERRVIEALAVFDRPVEETAVAYLLHPWWPGLDVRARLRRLVRGYFVSVNRVIGRYSLHPLDRDYAYRQIPDAIDKEPDSYNRRNLELRAAAFYASIRKPESEWKSIDDLEPQLNEFEHCVRAGDYDGACLVLEPIDSEYLSLWGQYTRLMEMRKTLLDHLAIPHLQATNLALMGNACYSLGQVGQAIKLYKEALNIAIRNNNRWVEGFCRGHPGSAYRAAGEPKQAIKPLKDALIIVQDIGDRSCEGIYLGRLGSAYRDLGQIERAIKYQEQALTIAREVGSRRDEGIWLGTLGEAYRILGQIERVIECDEESLTIDCELGDVRRKGAQLGHLGILYRNLGQVGQAIELYEEALTITREIGDHRNEVIWLNNLGTAHYILRRFKRATKLYEEALTIAREIDYGKGQSYQLLGLGKCLLAPGRVSEARRCCEQALEVFPADYQAELVLGIVLLHLRDPTTDDTFAAAAAHCQGSLDKTPGSHESRYTLAVALTGSAICNPGWVEENDQRNLLAPALEEYRRALAVTSAPGTVQDAIRDLELIRAAGIEGLESAFELLESAEYEPDFLKDLDEILDDLT
jgi:tetratricopeptide (TPR) repeat protein